jgi:hypothetical protein
MDNTTLQMILWIAAGLILVMLVMRRRKRKAIH